MHTRPPSHVRMSIRISVNRLAMTAAMVTVPLPVLAQAAATSSQVISISPISLLFGLLGAEYERRLTPASSFGLSAQSYTNDDFSYLSAEAKYRYYPQEKALEGFAVGVTGGVTRIGVRDDADTRSENDSGSALSLGFALDYQWLLGPRRNFAVILGTGARRLIPIGTEIDGSSLTLPTARIAIGRAF